LQEVEVSKEVVRSLGREDERVIDRVDLGLDRGHSGDAPQLLGGLDALVEVPLRDVVTYGGRREIQRVEVPGLRHEHLADRATTLEHGTHGQLESAALERAVRLLDRGVRRGDGEDGLVELAILFVGHVLHGVVRQDLPDVARVGHELELRLGEPLALDLAELHGVSLATEPGALSGALEVDEGSHRIGLLIDDLDRLVAVERAVDLVLSDALGNNDLTDGCFLTELLTNESTALGLSFLDLAALDFADEIAVEELRRDMRVLNRVTGAHCISFFLLKSFSYPLLRVAHRNALRDDDIQHSVGAIEPVGTDDSVAGLALSRSAEVTARGVVASEDVTDGVRRRDVVRSFDANATLNERAPASEATVVVGIAVHSDEHQARSVREGIIVIRDDGLTAVSGVHNADHACVNGASTRRTFGIGTQGTIDLEGQAQRSQRSRVRVARNDVKLRGEKSHLVFPFKLPAALGQDISQLVKLSAAGLPLLLLAVLTRAVLSGPPRLSDKAEPAIFSIKLATSGPAEASF